MEYEFAHEGYCNASRDWPVGCEGCSCRAGREIKRLRAALDPFAKVGSMIVDGNKTGADFGLQNELDDWGFSTYGDAVAAFNALKQ